MSTDRHPRNGIALATALVAIVIVSLFIAGSAFFSAEDDRASRNSLTDRAALEAAEYGTASVLRDWDPALNIATPNGATLAPISISTANGAATVRVTRTSFTTFWAVSEGTSGPSTANAQARRVLGVFYRLSLATPTLSAALTVRDSAEVLNGIVSGNDTSIYSSSANPWCSPLSSSPGIAAPDTSRICDGFCGLSSGHVQGAPPRLSDLNAGDSLRYLVFGDRTWQTLSNVADVVIAPNAIITPAPSGSGGSCQHGLSNWGDAAGGTACANYLPVIWARGDLTLSGGSGQGILLVDGDLRMGAGATFSGIVIARDDISFLSGGGTILGAAMSGDNRTGPRDHTIVDNGALIRRSSCAITRAILGSAPLERTRERSWAQLY